MAGREGEAEDEVSAVMVCVLKIPNHWPVHTRFAIQGEQDNQNKVLKRGGCFEAPDRLALTHCRHQAECSQGHYPYAAHTKNLGQT